MHQNFAKKLTVTTLAGLKQLPMNKVLLAIATFISVNIYAQQFSPIASSGTIPADFTTSTLDKIHHHQMEGDEEFNIQVYYGIDRILQSGEVCFNDPLSNYANRVLDVIKQHNPEIPNDVRIYTVKSPVVNAFSTQQGIIFVNAGLYAKIQNEAQLAFILCHELVHYQEKHVMQGYEQTEELKANNKDLSTVKDVADQVSSARFSRSMEKEADKKGLEMYLKTPYDPNAVNGVFDVLLYSYLPFKEVKFDSSFLSFGSKPIPSKFFKTELDTISAEEDIEDWRLTHPNIAKRKKLIKHTLGDSIVTGEEYVLPKTDFEAMRAQAQYEVMYVLTNSGSLSRALYAGYLLEQDYPESFEIKKSIGHVLFNASMMANTKDRNDVITKYSKEQGESQQVAYFLTKIKSKDLNILAARYNMELLKSAPDDSAIFKRVEILFGDLSYYYTIDKDEVGLASEEDNKTKWPYSMFSGADTTLIAEFYTKGEALAEEIKVEKANTGDEERDEEIKKQQSKETAAILKKGFAIGADRVVFLEPQTARYERLKKEPEPFKTIGTEELRETLYTQVKLAGKSVGVDVTYLGGSQVDSSNTDAFNDYLYVNQLLEEQLYMEDRANTTGLSDSTKALIEKYGTEYFALSAFVSTKSRNRGMGALIVVSIIFYPLLIYTIPRMFIKPKKSESMFLLFNIRTGQLEMFSVKTKKGKTTESKINSHYQYYFEQVAAAPRN